MATNAFGDADDLLNAGYTESQIIEDGGIGPFESKPGALFATTPGHTNGQKYIEDQVGHELKENARVWRVYNDESLLFDRNMVYVHRETIDIMLVFAGLFSAVVTTILVEVTARLEPDYSEFNTALLAEMVNHSRAASGAPLFPLGDLEFPGHFIPAPADVVTCGLWFVSLVLSLFVSLYCVVIKQWLSSYLAPISASPIGKATTRQLRYDSLHKWKVPFIIGMLPQLLTVSVLLFLVGLVIYLFTLNHAIAYVIATMSGFMAALYLISAIVPVFTISCPYKTSLTSLIYRILFATTRADMSQLEADMVSEESTARVTRAQCLFWLYDNTQMPAVSDLIMESLSGLYVEPTDEKEEQKWDLTEDHKEYERALNRRLRSKKLFAIELMEYIEAWWWSLPWDASEDLEDALDKEKIERVTRSALYLIQGGDHWKEMYKKLEPPFKQSSWPLRGISPRVIRDRTVREDEFEDFFRDKVLPTFTLWARKYGTNDVELRKKLADMDRRLDPEREQWARRLKEEQERKERLRQLEAEQVIFEAREQQAEAEIMERMRSDVNTSRASSVYNTPVTTRSALRDSQCFTPTMTLQVPSSDDETVTTPLLMTPPETLYSEEHARRPVRSLRHSPHSLIIPARPSFQRTTSSSRASEQGMRPRFSPPDDIERNAGLN